MELTAFPRIKPEIEGAVASNLMPFNRGWSRGVVATFLVLDVRVTDYLARTALILISRWWIYVRTAKNPF